jgi:hypothetical protein
MPKHSKKIYAYVDESGQDTKGLLFVVSILVFENEKEILKDSLEKAEKASGKKNVKWHKSKHEYRKKYIKELGAIKIMKNKIYFEAVEELLV